MAKILIKTVNQGTGIKTRIEGLQIGGKTGTAHIAQKGRYVNKYNTSFLGFVNDGTNKYTLGVTVIQPRTNHFASLTAVPVFKEIVEALVDDGYLTPDSEKFPLPKYVKKH
jgi:cell division protein FtsI (penicillin-binding protein 3)